MTDLHISLAQRQVKAANDLYARSAKLEGWRRSDEALDELNARFPDFGPIAVLLKSVAINSLYFTNVFAIQEMATHVADIISRVPDLQAVGADFIEELGNLNGHRDSFASKFYRTFVNKERFPVKDQYAVEMIGFHLGLKLSKQLPYRDFVEHFQRLKTLAGLDCSNLELDRYLWLAGEFQAFNLDPEAEINGELRQLFESPTAEEKELLAILQGARPVTSRPMRTSEKLATEFETDSVDVLGGDPRPAMGSK